MIVFFIVGGNQDPKEKPCAAAVGSVEYNGSFGAKHGHNDFVEALDTSVRNSNAAAQSRAAEPLTGIESFKCLSVGNA